MSCVVPYCRSVKSAKKSGEFISFHRFPDNYGRQLEWIAAVGRNNWMPTKHHRVCSKHFECDYFIVTCNKRLLMPNAIPTIFPRPLEMPLTSAERQRRYREKLKKENPDKYQAFKKEIAAKSLLYYREKVSQLTDEEKEKRRQQSQQRRVASEKQTSPTKKKIPLTPAEKQKRYREKLKQENPDKYEEYKKKIAAKSLLYYREKVSQYTDIEKENTRQQWREANRNQTSPTKKKIPLTPAERQKRYREKLKKENPDKYEEYKKKVAAMSLLYYREKASQLTDGEKEKRRQQWRDANRNRTRPTKKKVPLTPAERQKRYREKLKKENPDKYEEYKKKAAASALLYYREKASQLTDGEKEKRRQQWRDANRNQTNQANKQMPLTPDGGPKKYRERLEKGNPDKYEENKNVTMNYRCYRENADQYTEDVNEKRRQQCNASKLSAAEKKIQEKRKIEHSEKPISKCNNELAHISQTTPNEVKEQVKKRLTPAERQKRYREKLKRENPNKYVEIKNKAAEKSRQYYREKLSCNRDTYLKRQWNDVRGKKLSSGKRMKRYRERLIRENPAKYESFMQKPADSANRYYREKVMLYTEEERRQKWRDVRIYKEKQNDGQKQKQDETQMNGEESSSSEDDAQPGTSETPMTPPRRPNSPSVSDNSQDPLRKLADQCRFCGEDSKECLTVSSQMPYIAGNKTTLALNDTVIQLDFDDGLPDTVCTNCNTKLQEYCEFIKTVKTAQETLKRKIKTVTEARDVDVFIKTEAPDEEEINSISISDTIFLKKTVTYKRKGDVIKQRVKAKNVMVESDNEMIFDIKEEVVGDAGSETFSINVMGESENEMPIDIKEAIVHDFERIECARLGDTESETMSLPDELKYTCLSAIDENLANIKDRTGSVTAVNATRKARTESDTTVNDTRKARTGITSTVNATRKARTGSDTSVNATRKARTESDTTVNATRKARTESDTSVNATRAPCPTLVSGVIRLA